MSKGNEGFRQVKVRDHVYAMLTLVVGDMQATWDRAEPAPGRRHRVSMTDAIEQLLVERGRPVPAPKPRKRRKKA